MHYKSKGNRGREHHHNHTNQRGSCVSLTWFTFTEVKSHECIEHHHPKNTGIETLFCLYIVKLCLVQASRVQRKVHSESTYHTKEKRCKQSLVCKMTGWTKQKQLEVVAAAKIV